MADHAHSGQDEVPTGPAGTDSVGQPWSGRELSASGFEQDDGSADPVVRAALVAYTSSDDPAVEQALVSAVAAARWLVPVVATPGESGQERPGLGADVEATMSTVTITAPDGRRALPVFSGVDALARWDRSARPVPVSAARAAQAVIAQGCDVLLLDVGSDHAAALRPSMVWALAMARPWLPPQRDPHVLQAVDAAVAAELSVARHTCREGRPGEGVLQIVLGVRPGLTEDEVSALAQRLGERLATDGETRARIDALTFTVEPA